jgi:hypothetical protein
MTTMGITSIVAFEVEVLESNFRIQEKASLEKA